ncbi:protein phosphatase 2C domain-containing protein [Streptomyces sp. MUSC 14]|uniref:protein phosphatase 2C domain-containing protein n=1 Tax=Streptomyces sp. MUSC 14 TaxID=1354889 RepID=UPI000AAF2CC4|nr:protein phosphatase 2C domain-containing protein [Streptomyces sp. MUSC 14]
MRGASHRYYRQPRQDAARVAVHEATGSIVFAVADGVSSATNAEFGAVEACRSALERMLRLLSLGQQSPDFQDVAEAAAERLRRLARQRLDKEEPEQAEVAGLYATTLVAGVVRPDPAGPLVDLCRIGDSGAWLLDPAAGRYQQLFDSKTGSDALFVVNEVSPLPLLPDPLPRTSTRLAPHEVLLIGTDGFGDPLGDGDGQVGALFARHLAEPPTPLWFAHLVDFTRETFDDDRTLLAIWHRTAAASR